jgi:hypothetical protein
MRVLAFFGVPRLCSACPFVAQSLECIDYVDAISLCSKFIIKLRHSRSTPKTNMNAALKKITA